MNQKVIKALRASMPESVKYVTLQRQEHRMALDVFFLVGEQWRVARGVDYEALLRPERIDCDSGADAFWHENAGIPTDDEPPERWQAAREPLERLLHCFKLTSEFFAHMGWTERYGCFEITLAEQESLAGDIEAFLKTRLIPAVHTTGLDPMPRETLSEVMARKTAEVKQVLGVERKTIPLGDALDLLAGGDGRVYPEDKTGGCTCGAWVTPGARHDDYCDLGEA